MSVRITQVVRDVAIEPSSTRAEVSQLYADVAIMPDADVVIYGQFVEVLRVLPRSIFIRRELNLSGTPRNALNENLGPVVNWLRTRKKKLIFFTTLTIRRAVDFGSGAVIDEKELNLATHALNTTASDDPANTEFIAVLSDQDIPPLKQELSDALYGVVLPSFGKISINNADGQFDDDLAYAWEGGSFVLNLTGERSELDFRYHLTIFTGVMGKRSYSDTSISVEILSRTQELSSKNVPATTFVGTNGDAVFAPLCYGYVSNISPILKDAVEFTYKIAGHEIEDITAVYDNGVALSDSQYVKDLTNGEFTLVAVPFGTITCDVKGKLINGVFSAKRGDFVYDLVVNVGQLDSVYFDANALLTFNEEIPGDSGIYVPNSTPITEVINSLLRPVLGFIFFSRNNLFTIGRFSVATADDSVALTLTSADIFPQSDAEDDSASAGDVLIFEQVNQIYNSVTMTYNTNYTIQRESEIGSADPIDPETGAGAARRAYLSKDGLGVRVVFDGSTAGRNLYPTATDPDSIPSYFVNQSDAQGAAEYILNVFGVERRIVTLKTNLISAQATLNSVVEITYDIRDRQTGARSARFLNGKKARIVGYEENYSDGTSTLRLFY